MLGRKWRDSWDSKLWIGFASLSFLQPEGECAGHSSDSLIEIDRYRLHRFDLFFDVRCSIKRLAGKYPVPGDGSYAILLVFP